MLSAAVGVIPEQPFLWMTERQRRELRLRTSGIVVNFAAAVAGSRRACGPSSSAPGASSTGPRGDGLSVGEHIALVQRAQGIAKTDHAELVRAQHDLVEVQRELAEVRTEACTEI